MKSLHLTTWLILMALLSACIEENKNQIQHSAPTPPPTLWLLINDISKSDEYLVLPDHFVKDLITKNASRGICLAGLFIQSNSTRQIPLQSELIKIDTLEVEGNYLERGKAINSNHQLKEHHAQALDLITEGLNDFVLHAKEEQWTDVDGGLWLAKILLNQVQFERYEKNVLVLSDLLQDLPLRNNHIKSIDFPLGTKVFLMGVNPGVNYKKIFPNNEVILISNHQAITSN